MLGERRHFRLPKHNYILLLYGSESWTLYNRQERRLNTFHLRCLRRILGISLQDHIPNTEVLARAGTLTSMYALLTKRRLRWLGHVTRMHDGRLPKDILCGELATRSRPTGRPTLRYKDVLKQDLKAGGIAPVGFEALAADRSGWRREESSQAPESRDRGSPLGRQRLHMQRLQQGLPFEDRPLQPQPALLL